ncbi:MAG: vWA domain-containing protein, partial [Planctomycetia bacterium]
MTFLPSLAAWQWALALTVPAVVVALYFLKLKRKPLEVPSTYLWRKSIEDLRVNSLWQRLRRSILLLLQLLLIACLLAALLRPSFDASSTGRRLILLVDASASMAVREADGVRLDLAKRKAQAVIDGMNPGDAAMIIAFGDTARVVASYTENRPALTQALQGIAQTYHATEVREALSIASGLANPQKAGDDDAAAVPAKLYLFSDGRFPPLDDFSLGNLALEYIGVGASGDNVGVVALSARRSETAPDRLDVLARVRNFGADPKTVVVELLVDDRPADLQRAVLDPGGDQPIVFQLALPEEAVVSVKARTDDVFAVDDQAWLVVRPPQPIRVLIVGPPNPILQATFETEAVRKLAQTTFAPAALAQSDLSIDPQAAGYDLAIFDRVTPVGMPPCNTMLIGAFPPEMAGVEKTKVDAPIILDWNTQHPVLRYLSLDGVDVVDATVAAVPSGGAQLMESDRGALLFTVSRGVHTDLVQTFALIGDDGAWHTDWPLNLSFPLYMLNVVRSLGDAAGDLPSSYAPGDAVRLRGAADVETAAVTPPAGPPAVVRAGRPGEFDYLDAERIGVYEAVAGDTKQRFAVNLLNDEESDVKPAATVKIGAEA